MKKFEPQWLRGWTPMPRLKTVTLTHRPYFWSLLFLFCSFQISTAQIVINELFPNGSVELKNLGSTTVDVSSYWICQFPSYQQISSSNLQCGNMMMPSGSLLTVDDFNNLNNADGELALYTDNNFGSPLGMIDYVEWGSTGHQRSTVAVAAGIWTTGDFVAAFGATESLEYSGTGDASTDWSAQPTPTICAENGGSCTAEGGTVEGGPFEFCVGNDIADNVSGISVTGNTGTNFQWVVTNDLGNVILGLPPSPEAVNFDDAPDGACLIWHLSYEDGLVGLDVNMDPGDLVGCFDFSNSISVVRNQATGGTTSGGPFEFCVGDGIEDHVSGVTVSGNVGANSQWVVTNDLGNMILGLPPAPEDVNFDGAGDGTCLIWHLSYEDGLTGLEMGMDPADLDGCYHFSNSITVVRNQAIGGTLEGGPFSFCVGDGIADHVFGVTVSGNVGANSQWVVTDPGGNILGLPPAPEDVNFDDAPAGTCLIWHLSYEDGLIGLEVDLNVADLDGCYSLSTNSVTVNRNDPPLSGTIEGGPFEFCVGDGIEDHVSGVTLTGNTGTNSQWVVTNDLGTVILGLPPAPEDVNFDGAGGGTCLIWHLSYEDGLTGLEMGMDPANLDGCYSFSNSITVVRKQATGGTLEGGPFSFCVGDGIADHVSGVTVSGNVGTNSQWVVTDPAGNILGLPPTPEDVNFDDAPAGTCLIWHLSYEDGLVGLEVDLNVADMNGCYSLSSNSVTVNRNDPPLSGTIEGGPFEFCVGDGIEDHVSGVTLSGNTGTNSQWVVTNDLGTIILWLPPTPEEVNFDGAGGGTCLIWHLSYEDGLTGLEMGMDPAGLDGCYSFSNSITVVRNEATGGTIEGGPFEFCAGDGIEDHVSGVTLSGNTGTNSQWVVTNDLGTVILGLPPTPEDVNFDGAGGGTCLIWHLSYEDGLTGLEMDLDPADFNGCYSFSNSITVVRNEATGGTIEGGPFEFCVGDGIEDHVSGVMLSGNTGTNSQWVVTNDLGTVILGLPPTPEDVNFDGAGGGTCLIWHLSYEDGLTGLEMGMNPADLDGCYHFSNSITVVRSQPEGGAIAGGPFEFCVGDGLEDHVSGVTVSGNIGNNSQWVVTNDLGTVILGLPPTPEAVDFDGAGGGTCLIWHLSYEDGLTGLEMGMNPTDLDGCYHFSNSIAVVRNQVTGGTLAGGPFEFCVGDGEEDHVSGITLIDNTGPLSQWVVTDDQGNILGLPSTPEDVNFDDAPPGTCLIWHLSYFDGLAGLQMDMNIADLLGCFHLSNSITVNRLAQDDPGCSGSVNNYVLVAFDDLDMEFNIVHVGGVGVTEDDGEAEISEESQIVANGTWLKADEIHINTGASVNNAQAVPAMPDLPAFMENPHNPGNSLEVVVGANETVILTEEIYEDIKVKEGATIIFSGHNTVYIEDLETKSGVTILFDQCTNLVLSNKLYLNYDNQFNPGEEDVFVFADDDASIRPGSTVYGVIYTKEKLNIRKGSSDQPTFLHGMFIGEDIRTRDYAEYWYQFFSPCINIMSTPPNNLQSSGNDQAQVDVRKSNIDAAIRFVVYPNPATDMAYLSIDGNIETAVNVEIYSATNQLVSTKMEISSTQGEVALDLRGLPPGVYFVKALLENGETITEKLIVTK